MAPIADASVGVAIPPIIDPNTRIMRISGRASVLRISDIGAFFAFGSKKIFGFL